METKDNKQPDPQPLKNLLASVSLQHLVAKAQQITHANEVLHILLPSELAAHCHVMNFTTDHSLIIEVGNAAWATRIRYLAPELIQTLRQNPTFSQLTEIKCKVRSNNSTHT